MSGASFGLLPLICEFRVFLLKSVGLFVLGQRCSKTRIAKAADFCFIRQAITLFYCFFSEVENTVGMAGKRRKLAESF